MVLEFFTTIFYIFDLLILCKPYFINKTYTHINYLYWEYILEIHCGLRQVLVILYKLT
jgi:hypothetical protein